MNRLKSGLIGLAVAGSSVFAAELQIRVEESGGAALENAIIAAKPLHDAKPLSLRREIIDQINKKFVPEVKVVPMGTAISFPNKDNIRHHVYSFSAAKIFELPLYEGTPKNDVVFDKPGIVVLGCNIHDWMRAYIFVTDAPYFAITTSDGAARLLGLSPGDYELTIWHPRLPGKSTIKQSLEMVEFANLEKVFQLDVKKEILPRRIMFAGLGGGY